ncbi:unnamed protein product [Absidia cylindrospora]
MILHPSWKLDKETRLWLETQIQQHMNWSAIRALLRYDDDEMDIMQHQIEERNRFLQDCPKHDAISYQQAIKKGGVSEG